MATSITAPLANNWCCSWHCGRSQHFAPLTGLLTHAIIPPAYITGQQLVLKLAQYMRPKCHALLLDSSINCDTTVRLNIYQVWGKCGTSVRGACKELYIEGSIN